MIFKNITSMNFKKDGLNHIGLITYSWKNIYLGYKEHKITQVSMHQGQPQKSFCDCSDKRNRRKTEHVCSKTNHEILSCATQSPLYAAKMVKEVTKSLHLAAKCQMYCLIVKKQLIKSFPLLKHYECFLNLIFLKGNIKLSDIHLRKYICHTHCYKWKKITAIQIKNPTQLLKPMQNLQLRHLADHTVLWLLG